MSAAITAAKSILTPFAACVNVSNETSKKRLSNSSAIELCPASDFFKPKPLIDPTRLRIIVKQTKSLATLVVRFTDFSQALCGISLSSIQGPGANTYYHCRKRILGDSGSG